MTPTPEQLAFARRIAAHALCGPEKWKPGLKAGIYEAILRGDFDDEALVRGPLAAIIETTEAVERLLDKCCEPCPQCHDALRANEHLKGRT